MTRIAVVGGGISGLATALSLVDALPDADVAVFDAADRMGGRIATSPFAGVEHVDEGADSFLARVPEAVALARRVGLGDDLVSPEPVGAAVWHHGLHPIPDGLLLGVPGRLGPLARTGLLSWKGKARAALEPLLPRTSIDDDSIGAFVRSRFGDEVHERLVDSLVGSIYAADTDRFSLAEVPQLAALARDHRSLLLAARRQRAAQGTATAATSPIFAAPRAGMASLTGATADAFVAAGGTLRPGVAVTGLDADAAGSRLTHDGSPVDDVFDAVVFATPASVTGRIVEAIAPDAAALLGQARTADVIMVTLHVPAEQWPDRLRGMSGYLVPKPVQRWVTAASFASQKWAHWRPPGGGEILRVSLGRDGMEVLHLSDDEVLEAVLTDLALHIGVTVTPSAVRITRWQGAFAQYRPHHHRWVGEVERSLPAGVFVAGAGFRGIGIPACIRGGATATRLVGTYVADLEESGS
ncbi:MAG TPA: protoporphyrinogen oxidase [Ilumatobacteraceae bacterium]|nr:protoporphyrinogen oxidase [Ilumatobacteraceae bacterium]